MDTKTNEYDHKDKRQKQCCSSSLSSVPIIDMNVCENYAMSLAEFREVYDTNQVTLFRNCKQRALDLSSCVHDDDKNDQLLTIQDIEALFESLNDEDQKSWCIENSNLSSNLTAGTIGDNKMLDHSFLNKDCKVNGYCSFLIQHDAIVKDYLLEHRLPFVSLPIKPVKKFDHGPCLWFFYGRNNCDENSNSMLKGRPLHTDSISHDGTWHYQFSGTKIWYLRPTEELKDRRNPETKHACGESDLEIAIECREGDVLLVNTRLWWHRTDLPPSKVPSISYARDIFLSDSPCKESSTDNVEEKVNMTNVDGLYAANAIEEGTIVFREEDMPDCELYRSSDPNCEVIELKDGSGAIVSTRDIKAGEFFTITNSDIDSEEEEEEEEEEKRL